MSRHVERTGIVRRADRNHHLLQHGRLIAIRRHLWRRGSSGRGDEHVEFGQRGIVCGAELVDVALGFGGGVDVGVFGFDEGGAEEDVDDGWVGGREGLVHLLIWGPARVEVWHWVGEDVWGTAADGKRCEVGSCGGSPVSV